jgi:hypothetical protein
MLQRMKMDLKKYKWPKRASLKALFNMQWITPQEDLLKEFLQTWEDTKDG